MVNLSCGKGKTKIVASADIGKHKSGGVVGSDRRLASCHINIHDNIGSEEIVLIIEPRGYSGFQVTEISRLYKDYVLDRKIWQVFFCMA